MSKVDFLHSAEIFLLKKMFNKVCLQNFKIIYTKKPIAIEKLISSKCKIRKTDKFDSLKIVSKLCKLYPHTHTHTVMIMPRENPEERGRKRVR